MSRAWFWSIILAMMVAARGADSTNRPVRELAPGVFQIGAIRIEARNRTLVIPARVNMTEGPIEYVLVSPLGKLHESLFVTEAEPAQIHAAALLLRKEHEKEPVKVKVFAEFPGGERFPVERWIKDLAKNRAMDEGQWRYLGSRLVDGLFIAQRDGSIISVIADPDALVESGRVPAENDENWHAFKEKLPPLGTPGSIILEFGGNSGVDAKK